MKTIKRVITSRKKQLLMEHISEKKFIKVQVSNRLGSPPGAEMLLIYPTILET